MECHLLAIPNIFALILISFFFATAAHTKSDFIACKTFLFEAFRSPENWGPSPNLDPHQNRPGQTVYQAKGIFSCLLKRYFPPCKKNFSKSLSQCFFSSPSLLFIAHVIFCSQSCDLVKGTKKTREILVLECTKKRGCRDQRRFLIGFKRPQTQLWWTGRFPAEAFLYT